MFSDDDIKMASRICDFMMNLRYVDAKRYEEATMHCIPFGDMAYAQALIDWRKKGKPRNAFFSWADTEKECPLTIAFRKEISEKFGLDILTKEEAKIRRAQYHQVLDIKVKDWGPN